MTRVRTGNIGTAQNRGVDSSGFGTRDVPLAQSDMNKAASPSGLAAVIGRSLFPVIALVLLAGTFVWGPWVTLGATYVWWRLVGRIG